MFLKKENELDFACQSCGNCCRTFSINITHLDIERILENRPDLKTEDFISFSASTEKNDPESFVGTYGKRQVTLKTKPNSKECVFLKNNICSIHSFKPRVCKVWPFSLEKGKEITWIKEHRGFIKKQCQHTSIPSLNDPEELKQLIKQHYKERKIFSKIVEKWNQEKNQELKEGEMFSDILDEHFLEYIFKHINIKTDEIIEETKEEEKFGLQDKIIEVLKNHPEISVITSSNYYNVYSDNRNVDLSLNIFLKENSVSSFLNDKTIGALKESINSDKYIIDNVKNNCSFLINDEQNNKAKTLVLYVEPFDSLLIPQPYDTQLFYNSSDEEIKTQKFYDQTRFELEEIGRKFWFKLQQVINYIESDNYLDAKIQINSLFSLELCSLLYWLNQKNITLDNIDSLDYKTDNLKDFLTSFGNYSDKSGQIDQLNSLIDLFEKTWKLTGLNSDLNFISQTKNKINLLGK